MDDLLQFRVGNKKSFDLKLTDVTNTSLSGKNEVSIEFTPENKKTDELVEIRFYIPNINSEEVEETKEGEDAVNEITSAAALFHDNIRQRGEIGVIGESIITFQDLLCLVPRGRLQIDLFSNFFRLRGKSHDYKILFTAIKRMFLLQKPMDQHSYFIISLDPPLIQGQTRYPYLIFQFADDEDLECEMNLEEEELLKYDGKIKRSYDATTSDVISEIFHGLTGKKLIESTFKRLFYLIKVHNR